MNPADHAWWIASRASGIVAILLLTTSVLLGLTLSTRVMRGPGLPRWLAVAHEQAALAGLVAIGLHGVTLLGDPFLRPGLDGIAVPFAIAYKPVWVALGIVGGYVAAALGLSFYMRRRIGVQRWRKAHRFTIVAYGLSVAHTLGAGTDAGWLGYVVLAPAGPILVLFAQRMIATRRAAPGAAARSPAARATRPAAASPDS
ncbi:MAG: methionine sulfoxide reductase heme-binding subunit [Thermoleophilaceae bacterium]|jgi:sulfoxide reductase heme-binding subunit YedZ|nr:methionine sulfoxide reductase heme-binding subunit [Thermoleophilaceae bacterium]